MKAELLKQQLKPLALSDTEEHARKRTLVALRSLSEFLRYRTLNSAVADLSSRPSELAQLGRAPG